MKTQIQKPSSGKAKYGAEFKQQALEHWRLSGRSAAKVAAELGIRAPLLYRWAKDERQAAEHGGVPLGRPEHIAALQAEVERLKTENAKLLEQREVLKKSLGILSEPPPRSMPKSSK
jgi:transposase-like protein